MIGRNCLRPLLGLIFAAALSLPLNPLVHPAATYAATPAVFSLGPPPQLCSDQNQAWNCLEHSWISYVTVFPHLGKVGQKIKATCHVLQEGATCGWTGFLGFAGLGKVNSGCTEAALTCTITAKTAYFGLNQNQTALSWAKQGFSACGTQFGSPVCGTSYDYMAIVGADQYTIEGHVTDVNNAPVAGATVRVRGTGSASTTTDSTGYYSFIVKAGSYTVSAPGAVASVRQPITLGPAKPQQTVDLSDARFISTTDQTVDRPRLGTKTITVPVSLSSRASSTITVEYATEDGTATAGTDYDTTSGTLTFNPGVTHGAVLVNVHPSSAGDPEVFTVNLSDAVGGIIEQGTAHITLNPSALVVNNAGDQPAYDPTEGTCDTERGKVNGDDCTLRAAIQVLNANPTEFSRISFKIPNTNLITLGDDLPAIEQPVTIDGTSQTGGAVQIDGAGTLAPNGVLTVKATSTLKGLDIFNAEHTQPDILVSQADGTVIQGCHIGADASFDSSNNGVGIAVLDSKNMLIGGTGAGQGNIIGNTQGFLSSGYEPNTGMGIKLWSAPSATIQGNDIGTNGAAGAIPVPNSDAGIDVHDSANVTIGGAAAGAGNVIMGVFANKGLPLSPAGIRVEDGSAHVQIVNNQIGYADGQPSDRQLIHGQGVMISDSLSAVVQNNSITGSTKAGLLLDTGAGLATVTGNTIGYARDVSSNPHIVPNLSDGILVKDALGVTIGGQSTPSACADPCNMIVGNVGAGIHLEGADSTEIYGNSIGVSPNDGQAGNGEQGILVDSSSKDNKVGDTGAGDGNLIKYNLKGGIQISANSTNTAILSNAIFDNPKSNSSSVPDIQLLSGANGGILPPTIASATTDIATGKLTVQGTLPSSIKTGPVLVQVFVSDGLTPELETAQTLLSTQQVKVGANHSFTLTMDPPDPATGYVEATLSTLDSHGNPLNTSEYSGFQQIVTP